MISSMTAFGSGQASHDHGTVIVELRSVNSRFLDVQCRLPDELRLSEPAMRERVTKAIRRGKIEIRASFTRSNRENHDRLNEQQLVRVAEQLANARRILPETPSPTLAELLNGSSEARHQPMQEDWADLCMAALEVALTEIIANRIREGTRLGDVMKAAAQRVADIVKEVETHVPALVLSHQERLVQKLQDTMNKAFPNGLSHISGQELFERITAEASLFSMRIDVSEELARLNSHVSELMYLLENGQLPLQNNSKAAKTDAGSVGKRLDFLFQEMNRESNTLGSKSASIDTTRASMDLKLLIEQMREQAQNIE